MTTLFRPLLPLAALLSTFLAGCSSSTQIPADEVAPDDESLQYRVVLADDLRGDVAYESPVARRTEQNLLELRVPIRNLTRKDLRLMLQMVFADESGAPSGDETNRQYHIVPRGGTWTFNATSRTSSARDYKLYIWRAEK